ncbi:TadE/TadG family type IV pilus assembly protein [Nocardioides sp. GXZ039]|uniref:TadE/TadG family type IV pilus assembly protein n=1 Tax=Nocardioides sp. GXZ039 TaxID=3136018 RepID=UPI0030F4009F
MKSFSNRVLSRMRRARRTAERGAATAFVVGMAIVLLACAGLVVDGGGALNARMKLADDVEQAARAGAQQLNQEALYGDPGSVVIEQDAASARIQSYLAARGHRVTAIDFAPGGDSVTVTAADTVDTRLLNLVGINKYDIEATATAETITQ